MYVDDDPHKLVCVCDRKECGKIKFVWPEKVGQVAIVTSSRSGRRFFVHYNTDQSNSIEDKMIRNDGLLDRMVMLNVDLSDRHQTILGWGGAFTDAAGVNIFSLSDERTNELIESYYGDTGLQYNFGRVPIAGTDFSTRPYTYDDTKEPDYLLTNWSLAKEDLELKIPMIKMAKKLMEKSVESKEELKLFSAPWSPPAWMKTNQKLIRGFLNNTDPIYRSYAEYLMKFFDAYEEKGIKFWGTSVQNEPFASFLPVYFFNSLQLGAKQASAFIGEYLGPALEARNRTKENGFHLMVGDDSLGYINNGVPDILASPETSKYVSGLAFHWYTSGRYTYDLLTSLYDIIKKDIDFMLMTEACTGSFPWEQKVDLGSWLRGQQYASDIIEDLNRETNGWIDWNLALNLKGGPNWSGNFVDSPILVDSKNDLFYKQPMYYALAHFSRLFRPGSVRVGVTKEGGLDESRDLLSVTAVHREETGHLVITILNKSEDLALVRITLPDLDKQSAPPRVSTLQIDGKSLVSVVWKL